MRSRFTSALLLLIAVAVVVVAADDKFNGTWKLNLAKSKRRVSTSLRHSFKGFSEYLRLSLMVC